MDIFDTIALAGLVPVIKIEDASDAVPLCRALKDGGLPVAEITFRSDAAEQAIINVHAQMPEIILGAGTVLTCQQVDRAVKAGAAYIVSPGFNPKVVAHCISIGVPILPGCANPSDIEMALEFGLRTVKFFPAEALGGLNLIKAMSAPYGSVTFVPTGGIDEKNVLDYLAFPKVKAVGGSWMVPADAIGRKDWARITELTRKAVALVLGFELSHIGINSGTPVKAGQDAQLLAGLLGWPVTENSSSVFCGTSFECMKEPFRGTHGHIALSTNSISRAKWNLRQRGFDFDEEASFVKDGKTAAICLKNEISGFSVHLVQK